MGQSQRKVQSLITYYVPTIIESNVLLWSKLENPQFDFPAGSDKNPFFDYVDSTQNDLENNFAKHATAAVIQLKLSMYFQLISNIR